MHDISCKHNCEENNKRKDNMKNIPQNTRDMYNVVNENPNKKQSYHSHNKQKVHIRSNNNYKEDIKNHEDTHISRKDIKASR